MFNFTDDLCNFHNDEFENNYSDIYLHKLEPNMENKDPCKALLLDFSIKVHGMKFTDKLFHKRDDFPFHIYPMPYLDSTG